MRRFDNGPGLDPADVPRLFAVNRPLLSSKRRRLPLRGMLGNGLKSWRALWQPQKVRLRLRHAGIA